MSGQIRMTPETMRERATAYRTEGENLQAVIDKMQSLVDLLLTEWEGKAAEAYAEKFSQLRPGFDRTRELVDEIATSLDTSARLIEETDAHIASEYSK